MYTTSLLKGLATAGSISRLTARGVPGGFVLWAKVGLEDRPLKAYRGQARVFKRLDAVAKYVKDLGIDRFEVELCGWATDEGLI